MRIWQKWALAAGFVAALSAAPLAKAHDDGDDEGKGGEWKAKVAQKMKENLKLSDKQAKAFEAENKANREAIQPLRDKLREDMAKLKTQVDSKAKDDAIKGTLSALEADQEALRAQEMKHRDAVKGILNPTQQAKIVLWMGHAMKEGMMGHGMMGGGKGHGWGNGEWKKKHGKGGDKDYEGKDDEKEGDE